MTEERKHCWCLPDESCVSCSFALSVKLAEKGPTMVERNAVVAFLLRTELDATSAYAQQRTGLPRGKAETVAKAMASALQAVRKGIERGDHLRPKEPR